MSRRILAATVVLLCGVVGCGGFRSGRTTVSPDLIEAQIAILTQAYEQIAVEVEAMEAQKSRLMHEIERHEADIDQLSAQLARQGWRSHVEERLERERELAVTQESRKETGRPEAVQRRQKEIRRRLTGDLLSAVAFRQFLGQQMVSRDRMAEESLYRSGSLLEQATAALDEGDLDRSYHLAEQAISVYQRRLWDLVAVRGEELYRAAGVSLMERLSGSGLPVVVEAVGWSVSLPVERGELTADAMSRVRTLAALMPAFDDVMWVIVLGGGRDGERRGDQTLERTAVADAIIDVMRDARPDESLENVDVPVFDAGEHRPLRMPGAGGFEVWMLLVQVP